MRAPAQACVQVSVLIQVAPPPFPLAQQVYTWSLERLPNPQHQEKLVSRLNMILRSANLLKILIVMFAANLIDFAEILGFTVRGESVLDSMIEGLVSWVVETVLDAAVGFAMEEALDRSREEIVQNKTKPLGDAQKKLVRNTVGVGWHRRINIKGTGTAHWIEKPKVYKFKDAYIFWA